MDVSVTDGDEKKRAEVMKAILGLLKRAARETASVTGKIIYIFETRKMNFVFTCWFFVFIFLCVLSMCDFFEISLFFCSIYILYPHTIKLFLTSFFFIYLLFRS